ncbi:hypothetical protein IW140_000628 [Coemansia sp. RSA 1813]|nr:hypothetical protein EV178_003332 [Coemansia sp. RSA 1646]KAJ1774097.1 hypothetical protein LPJ74_000196 [Coemansia sp. RSA 1843]KAJ2092512.1 hypothetical protein IW138_000950 [Coemansia sp. RSA 986]KAJ2216793.1 hypothetical protein EV179_001083 [Coemansia sp. RSA 487]KAJ2572865.1 hypothetical protein IW140_000628 [Coemansia sp. RSA 1813]
MTNSEGTKDIHVVIVGISFAGMNVSKALAKLQHPGLRITMIDQRAYYYHTIGMPRALVDRELAKSLAFPLAGFLDQYEQDPSNPRHRFIQASVTNVTTTSVSLNDGSTVPFDFLVLATGVSNTFPATVSTPSIEDAKTQLTTVHANVEKAKQILVIGGGAVGVESAGELADAYPEKQVTLVHSGPHLLPSIFKPALHSSALNKLQALGVRIVLNERVDIPENTVFDCAVRPMELHGSSGTVYQSDLQLLATGASPNARYIQSLEDSLGVKLRDPNGAIRVRPTLQLDSDACDNIFVPGDVNNLPAGSKFAMVATPQAELVAANIKAMIDSLSNGQDKPLALKQWDNRVASACIIPLGRSKGVGQLFGIVLGNSRFADFIVRNLKGKDYFVSTAAKNFKSSK